MQTFPYRSVPHVRRYTRDRVREKEGDTGAFIERTDLDSCSQCGACVDVCHFKARTMGDGELTIDRGKYYGCGLCIDVCPVDCIEMIGR